MGKDHIKRIATPRTWEIKRKITKFITRQNDGAHKITQGMALNVILRDMIEIIKNTKEAKYVIKNKIILINNKKARDYRMNVGLFDVITIPDMKENYRMLIDTRGKLYAKKISDKEANITPYKIENKTILNKTLTQINMSAGKNIRMPHKEAQKYKTGDTILFNTKDNKIEKHIELKKDTSIYFIEGKHIGQQGMLQEKTNETYDIKIGNETINSTKEKLFALGDKKPEIEL